MVMPSPIDASRCDGPLPVTRTTTEGGPGIGGSVRGGQRNAAVLKRNVFAVAWNGALAHLT
jgi:hypothetical protein